MTYAVDGSVRVRRDVEMVRRLDSVPEFANLGDRRGRVSRWVRRASSHDERTAVPRTERHVPLALLLRRMEDFPFDISWAQKLERKILSFCEIAMRSPDTALLRMQKQIGRAFETGFPREQEFSEMLAQVYEWMAPRFDQLREQAAAHIIADTPGTRRYWKLFCEAHKRHPGSPLIMICEHESLGRAKLRALAALTAAETCDGTGEQKAKAALAAAGPVVDLYKVYLAKLEVLHYLTHGGKRPGKNVNPGHLCRSLAPQFKNPKIVDPEIVHVRNAHAHGHFTYLGHRRLHLWDGSGAWLRNKTTSELLRQAAQALDAVYAFERALHAFVFQFHLDLLRPVIPKMAPMIRGELDAEELEWSNREYEARKARSLRGVGSLRDLFGRGEDVRPARALRH